MEQERDVDGQEKEGEDERNAVDVSKTVNKEEGNDSEVTRVESELPSEQKSDETVVFQENSIQRENLSSSIPAENGESGTTGVAMIELGNLNDVTGEVHKSESGNFSFDPEFFLMKLVRIKSCGILASKI